MTKELNAKFTSRCKACGSTINPGDLISYDPAVKYSSRHVTCPSTIVHSKVPLNSPGRGALQGRGRSDLFLGEKTDIVLGWTSESRADQSDLGWTIKAKDGRYLTCVGVGSHYVSQDEADDFDLVGPRGCFDRHWSLTKYYRIATTEEEASCVARIEAAARLKAFDHLCDYCTGEGWEWATSEIKAQATDRVQIWNKSVGYSGHFAYRTSLGLLTFHPVYDDSPRERLLRWEKMTPEQADMVRSAPEVK